MKALLSMAAALSICLLLMSGCGGGKEATAVEGQAQAGEESTAQGAGQEPRGFGPELQVALDGGAGPQNVGILLAEEKGLFAKAGLKVWAGAPLSPQRPIPYVVSEVDDVAITQEPQLALAKEEGAPVVAVGSLVSQPTAAMIWLPKSGIRSIADLRGKTIAIPGVPFQLVLLDQVLAQAGVSPDEVEVEEVGYGMAFALLSGRADAAFGGAANLEGVELEAHGAHPVVKSMRSMGIPEYEELVVVVREDLLAEEPGRIHRFMAAASRGTAMAIAHPKAAVDLLANSNLPSHDLARKTIAAKVAATLPLLNPSGAMDPGKARETVEWMSDEGLISSVSPSALIAPGFG